MGKFDDLCFAAVLCHRSVLLSPKRERVPPVAYLAGAQSQQNNILKILISGSNCNHSVGWSKQATATTRLPVGICNAEKKVEKGNRLVPSCVFFQLNLIRPGFSSVTPFFQAFLGGRLFRMINDGTERESR